VILVVVILESTSESEEGEFEGVLLGCVKSCVDCVCVSALWRSRERL
jgi:hypothetical protein